MLAVEEELLSERSEEELRSIGEENAPALALEHLLEAEHERAAVRDRSPAGLAFYPNAFRDFAALP